MGRNGGSAMHQGSPMLKADPALAAEKPAAHSLLGESLPPEVSRNVLDQVIKGVSVQIQGSTSEMRLTLKPESLGEVVVRVRMEDGKMQAQIDVTQAGVKAALESNLPQLHEALAARGIDVQRIDVNAGGQSMLQDRQGRSDERRLRRSMSDTAPDGVEQYQAVKLVGYNTMDLIM